MLVGKSQRSLGNGLKDMLERCKVQVLIKICGRRD